MRIAVVFHNAAVPATAGDDDYKGRRQNSHVRAICRALTELGHQVIRVRTNQRFFRKMLRIKSRVHLVFNLADEGFEYDTTLEPQLPALLDVFGMRYTGAGHLSLALSQDKVRTKQLLIASRLPTPRFAVFERPIGPRARFALRFPVIVKPARQDGSIGIRRDSVVDGKSELIERVNTCLRRYRQPALVEEFIDGREVNVGIIGRKKLEVLPMAEIIFRLPKGERPFLWYESKWERRSRAFKRTTPQCPARLRPGLQEKLTVLATAAYRLLGVGGYGRIDFRIDGRGRPYILEVNPNPDISPDAGFARMGRAAGLDYPALLKRIVKAAVRG